MKIPFCSSLVVKCHRQTHMSKVGSFSKFSLRKLQKNILEVAFLRPFFFCPCVRLFYFQFIFHVQNLKRLGPLAFGKVAQCNYFRTITVTNWNSINDEAENRLNCGNACYHLFQSNLSPHVFSLKSKHFNT
jgi:hypothetical protein